MERRYTSSTLAAATEQPRPLGILAAGGPLPIELAEAGNRSGRPIHIVAIDGFAGGAVERFPHERVSVGQVGRMISSFKRAGVTEIVIAGAMQRPNLVGLRIDWGFVSNLPTVLALTRGGDDSVLRRVVRFFESHEFKVIGASDVAPDLLAPPGLMTRRGPSAENEMALARAAALIADLGQFDIGQGIVAGPNGIVAVEGLRGTDAMLADLGPGGTAEGRGRGGVLVKLAKPGQEMRIDLPTIGPETVRGAAAAGMAGIAVGARGAIVLERQRVVEAADQEGLFVTGIEASVGDFDTNDARVSAPYGAATESVLPVVARRAPTPGQRRDIAMARQALAVLRRHQGGHAVLVSREHVLAVTGASTLAEFVSAQGRTRTWGRRLLGQKRGVLVVDGAAAAGKAESILDVALFSAARDVSLAGIVVLAPLSEGEQREQCRAWANEAGVFLMCPADVP
ncbi:MAG: LpxI family protein [Hyphomicrobiaceae bacterium]